MKKYIFFWTLAFILILSACSGDRMPPVVDQTAPPRITQARPTATGTATPTAIATALPTLTPTATQTATHTPTATPTLHPLTLGWLKDQAYPGSEITIEETLEPGPNYNRYLAAYRSEGFKIYALLTIPYGEKPATGWPVIVFNHGYIPPAAYRTTERYIAYVDGFARSGYIVFRPDYRGHGNSEGEARGAYGSPDYTIDVLNAVAALKAHPDADPGRIGMWGHSMGGYITLRSMVVSEDIKAGVIWAGVVGPYPSLFERPVRTNSEGARSSRHPTPRLAAAAGGRSCSIPLVLLSKTPNSGPRSPRTPTWKI